MVANGGCVKYDKKTGRGAMTDAGKEEDGREHDFLEMDEAQGEQFMAVRLLIVFRYGCGDFK